MASNTMDLPDHERRIEERRAAVATAVRNVEGLRVSWGGIFGGVLVATGVVLLLTALGLAIGISAVNPGETDAGNVGAGAGIWAALSLLGALFIGGMAATRMGAIFDRSTGFFEGALVWVVSVLLISSLAASGVSMVASGAFSLVGGAGQAVSGIVSSGSVDLSEGGVDQIIARLDAPATARNVATVTGIPQSEVQTALSEISQRVQDVRDDPAAAAAEVRRGVADLYAQARADGRIAQVAEDIQPQVSTAAWITFGALVLSLLAAVLGAMAGRRRTDGEARLNSR